MSCEDCPVIKGYKVREAAVLRHEEGRKGVIKKTTQDRDKARAVIQVLRTTADPSTSAQRIQELKIFVRSRELRLNALEQLAFSASSMGVVESTSQTIREIKVNCSPLRSWYASFRRTWGDYQACGSKISQK